MTVKLYFDRREVADIYRGRNDNRKVVGGADGTFGFDERRPGCDFRFLFSVGRKHSGPKCPETPEHGDTLTSGDLEREPAGEEG